VGEKLLGTFVVPGGLASALLFAGVLAGGTSQTGGCPTPQLLLHRCVVGGTHTVTHGPSVLGVMGAVLILAPAVAVPLWLASRARYATA